MEGRKRASDWVVMEGSLCKQGSEDGEMGTDDDRGAARDSGDGGEDSIGDGDLGKGTKWVDVD